MKIRDSVLHNISEAFGSYADLIYLSVWLSAPFIGLFFLVPNKALPFIMHISQLWYQGILNTMWPCKSRKADTTKCLVMLTVIDIWTVNLEFFSHDSGCRYFTCLDFVSLLIVPFRWAERTWVSALYRCTQKFLKVAFFVLWLHLKHMEVPSPGTESEPQPQPVLQVWQCHCAGLGIKPATQTTAVTFLTYWATAGTPYKFSLT